MATRAGTRQDPKTARIDFLEQSVSGAEAIKLKLPEGKLITARGYPVVEGIAQDADSRDLLIDMIYGELERQK